MKPATAPPTPRSAKNKYLKGPSSLSRTQLTVFAVAFALIGGYVLYRSFAAAPLVASIEGEQMSQPVGSKIVTDTSASGGKTLELVSTANATPSPTAKPAIPTGLKATAGNGSVTLSWNANPTSDQVDTYQVYYGTVSSFSSFSTYIPGVSGTSYTVSGLTNGKTYYFKISAHDSVGYGPWSANPVGATPTATTTNSSKPAIPTGLKATAGNGSVTLTWNANPAADQVNTYQVYYAPNSSFTNFKGYVPSVNGTTYIVTGLTNGTAYYFRVSAHNSVGYGPWNSPPVSAVPTASTTKAAAAAPTSTTITTTGSVNLPSGVTSLTVTARGDQCSGAPQMNVAIDSTTLISAASVSSTSWTSFPANTSLSSGAHTLTITFANPLASSTCTRNLYIDVTNFYGPNVITPPPTATISATPTSVTAGSAATITWSSSNATNCSSSGAWSGTNIGTSGSKTTGALNQTSTYTISCNGANNQVASMSTTVTVTQSSGGGGSGSSVIHGMYDSNGTQSAFTADWPSIAAQDINMLILPSEWISNLQTLKAAGDSAWVTAGYWNDSTGAFSLSQAQAVSDVTAACATGVVKGIYVADEPSSGQATIKTRAAALKAACPSAQTIIAYYDAGSVASWKGVTDAIALDIYPSRSGFNYSLITQLAAVADAAGIPYYGVVGAFTDGTANYPLPTAAQLTTMFTTWEATHELGWVVYSWGATGGATATQLQNQPSLLSVIKSNADK